MKDETRRAFDALGMNIEQTMARFVGNEALLLKFLKRFIDDGSYAQLKEAVAENRMDDAFRAAHTLKGVAGNLGLDALFSATSPLVETLRQGDVEQSNRLFRDVEARYDEAIEIIRALD